MIYDKVMEIRNVMDTTFEDGTHWVEYAVGKDGMSRSECKVGFEVSKSVNRDTDKTGLVEMINGIPKLLKKFVDKMPVTKACSPFLNGLILECLQSENEMWYVDYEDLEEDGITQEMLDKLLVEVTNLNIQDCVAINDGDYAICVYGDVITRFLF